MSKIMNLFFTSLDKIYVVFILIITIIVISPWLEIPGGHTVGYSQILRADEALFSLGWQSSRDGVSIKMPVVV